jgi:hypothetical protein
MEDSNQNQPQTHNPGSWQPPMPEQPLQAAETQPAYVPQTTAYEAMQPTAASQDASNFQYGTALPTSGPQLLQGAPVPGFQPQPTKPRPPASVQVYFILTIVGLALTALVVAGLLLFAFMFSQGSQSTLDGSLLGGFILVGVIMAALLVGEFFLAYYIRKGSRLALIISTVLMIPTLGVVVAGMSRQQFGDWIESGILYVIVPVVFYVCFWTKDRHYFK